MAYVSEEEYMRVKREQEARAEVAARRQVFRLAIADLEAAAQALAELTCPYKKGDRIEYRKEREGRSGYAVEKFTCSGTVSAVNYPAGLARNETEESPAPWCLSVTNITENGESITGSDIVRPLQIVKE